MVQNGSQDGPKTGLRWTSFPKPLPKPFLVRFWSHLGSNLGPSWGPSWGHVGPKIDFWKFPKACKNGHDFQHLSGPSWDRCWADFGVQNRTKIGPRSVSRAIMKQMQRSSKTTAPPTFFDIFAFASWSFLRPILDRFWFHFGNQNRSKIGPDTVKKRIKLHCRLWRPSRTS